ncbi:MAG: T9SS type A sorting domain-containing protein [Chitinophagaceae bacterium]
MKKKILFAFLALASFASVRATVHIISVSNFQFSPSTQNAIVGDTIKWVWVSGFHTTSSTSVPASAATWDAPMQSATDSFLYKLTVAGTYKYQCNIHPNLMQGTLNVTSSLPVILSAFTISTGKNNDALLSWKTATEINTSYFSVRKSYDGNGFAEIAKVTAADNSTTEKTYNYSDGNVGKISKYIYYMLAIVDKDGSMQYSQIKMFTNSAASAKLITQLSPNPLSNSGHLMLQFNADNAGEMLAQVFDVKGKLVEQVQMTAVPGLNNGHLHLNNLASGTYNIVFTLDNLKETHRIVVQ